VGVGGEGGSSRAVSPPAAKPECCGACRDRNQEVWSHHVGLTWLTLASCSSVENLQASNGRVYVDTRSLTVIPGWRLRTGLICCWLATPAVCQHKDAGALPDKNWYRYQGICCFCRCRVEQLPHGTSNDVLLSTNFCAKTQQHPVYQLLRAHLRSVNFALYKCTRYYYYYYYLSSSIINEEGVDIVSCTPEVLGHYA